MPRSSSSIANLAAALAKAQGELVNPEKSMVGTIRSDGPRGTEQTFRYAPLSSGLDIVRKTLGQHEIATMQTTAIDQSAGVVNLTTMLAHASGEWIASDWPVCAIGEAPHRMGTALTYARRYALFTLVGIAGEDDLDAPDLATPTQQTEKLEKPKGGGDSRLNGGQPHRAQRPAARRPGKVYSSPSEPILGPEASAELCDRLVAKINGLTSSDDAAIWAHGNLAAKNRLTAADAQHIEDAFKARLLILTTGAGDLAQTSRAAGQILTPQQQYPGAPERRSRSTAIDKSALALPEPRRLRDREHVRYVAKHPCLVCGRQPSDPHHLRFTQSRALGRKVSDEFTVPLCRGHHREVHHCSDEAAWWRKAGIDPTVTARALWLQSRPLPMTSDKIGIGGTISSAAVGSDDRNSGDDRPVSRRRPNYKTKPIIAAGPR
jgi:hypothetical protein